MNRESEASIDARQPSHWWESPADRQRWHAKYYGRAQRRATMFPPSLEQHLMRGWDTRFADTDSWFGRPGPANEWLYQQIHGLKAVRYRAAYDEALIRDHAENYSMLCAAMLPSLERCREFGASMGVDRPEVRISGVEAHRVQEMLEKGERGRWIDPRWWRRQLRKAWTRQSEEAMRGLGIIRREAQPYASDEAVEHRAARQRRTREWMRERIMVNDAGEQLDLTELHKSSLANPALRRGEFMCRMRGFEEFAKEAGHVALFWTLTTPSRFHAQRAVGGINPAWESERARVRDGQNWLCTMWARARAKLARRQITVYGFRVAEPHHDATPHWHAVLFVQPEHVGLLRDTLQGVWLSDAGTEPGAEQFRTKYVVIDATQGSATGYVAKYVSKNIDGAGEIGDEVSDETGGPVAIRNDKGELVGGSVVRVAAWAAAHGIRQFQQIGGPPVGLWREARRLRDPVAPALIESVRTAADAGKWREFIGALGGMERARRRVSSKRHKITREMRRPNVRFRGGPRGGWRLRPAEPEEMPAVWVDRQYIRKLDPAGRDVEAATCYGEQPSPRAAGLCSFGLMGRYVVADTRPHRWRIEKKCALPSDCGTPAGMSESAVATEQSLSSAWGLSGSGLSAPRSGAPALGPVAITVPSGDDALSVSVLIEQAREGPNYRDFDPATWQWPPDIPKYRDRRTVQ